jgi:aspartate kinase
VSNRVVIKFGGADLATGEKVAQAAGMVADASYKEIIVVVSAMGKTTDILLNTTSQIGDVSDPDYAELISMGERVSVRFFCSALRARGAKAEFFDPCNDNWPLMTDSNFRNAKPDMEKTAARARKFIAPLLSDTIAVVCGFAGKDPEGRITSLGRGGSDTTALVLAKCLDADEVILVKETSGVLSADPKIVSKARSLNKLDIREMFDLAQGGAKIVKPEALRYKQPNQMLRIVDFSSGNLSVGGTEITGSLDIDSSETQSHNDLIAVNVVCEVNAKNLSAVFSALTQKRIYGISSGSRSLTVFTSDGNIADVIRKLHGVASFKAVSHRENVAMLQVSHSTFIESPGGVAALSTALSQQGINIIEVTTSKATINVFIEENQLNKAKDAIKNVFKP